MWKLQNVKETCFKMGPELGGGGRQNSALPLGTTLGNEIK